MESRASRDPDRPGQQPVPEARKQVRGVFHLQRCAQTPLPGRRARQHPTLWLVVVWLRMPEWPAELCLISPESISVL